jgi:hypothetical protein
MSAGPVPSPERAPWWPAVALAGPFLVGLAVLSLAGSVPLTYDEAYNFTDLSSAGVGYVLTHYPNPNNHVAFTALQALLLPAGTVRGWPLLLRLPNLIVATALLGLLA